MIAVVLLCFSSSLLTVILKSNHRTQATHALHENFCMSKKLHEGRLQGASPTHFMRYFGTEMLQQTCHFTLEN